MKLKAMRTTSTIAISDPANKHINTFKNTGIKGSSPAEFDTRVSQSRLVSAKPKNRWKIKRKEHEQVEPVNW